MPERQDTILPGTEKDGTLIATAVTTFGGKEDIGEKHGECRGCARPRSFIIPYEVRLAGIEPGIKLQVLKRVTDVQSRMTETSSGIATA